MTLPELEETLPNGFHDAGLVSLTISFDTGVMIIGLKVDVSSSEARMPDYKQAFVHLHGLRGFICDRSPFAGPVRGSLAVCGVIPTERELPQLNTLEEDARRGLYSFFIVEWNSFLHIAADEASLTWAE